MSVLNIHLAADVQTL